MSSPTIPAPTWTQKPSWLNVTYTWEKWKWQCSKTIPEMKCCAYCGTIAYQGSEDASKFRLDTPRNNETTPPAVATNAGLHDHMKCKDTQMWQVCHVCRETNHEILSPKKKVHDKISTLLLCQVT
jgi:hypothetical protein